MKKPHALDRSEKYRVAPNTPGLALAGPGFRARRLGAASGRASSVRAPLGLEELEARRLLTSPAFDLIGLTSARNDPTFAGIDGSGVTVAVIDTGLDQTHPLLAPNYRAGFNFINNSVTPIDTQGHGTHVSGTVGARNPDIGVAPDVGLIGLRVFPDNGGASNRTISSALKWVLNHRVEYNIVAVNMSLGAGFFTAASQAMSDIYYDDIRSLEAAGVTVVSAAGNSYKDHETLNAASPGIISSLVVGAVWQDGRYTGVQWGSGAIDNTTGPDRIASFSQRINAPNMIFAPGALIYSTYLNGGYNTEGGTSMASPMISGVVALLQEAALKFGGRELTTSEVVNTLRTTSDTIIDGDDENDNVTNTGLPYPRVNVYSALKAVKAKFDQLNGNTNGVGDPNGTIVGAVRPSGPIGAGGSFFYNGTIGTDSSGEAVRANDVDLVRVELTQFGTLAVRVGPNANAPRDFDSYLRIFSENGTELVANNNEGSGSSWSALVLDLAAGTYYLGVSGNANTGYDPNTAGSGASGSTGNYTLLVALDNSDNSGTIGGAGKSELGDYRHPLTIDGVIGSDEGVATEKADVDIFSFFAPDAGTMLINLNSPYDTDFVDTYVRVFDENGVQIGANDNGLALDILGKASERVSGPQVLSIATGERVGHTSDSFLRFTVTRGQTIYVGISHPSNKIYDPLDPADRPATSPTGRYQLQVQFINNDANGAIPQSLDGSAIPLPVVGQPGTIGFDGVPGQSTPREVGDRDVDMVKIQPTADGILEIDIDSFSIFDVDTAVDTVLYLFDGDGNLLAVSDDTDATTLGGLDPLLRYRVKAGETYYAAVVGFGNEGFDPYLLGSGSSGETGSYEYNQQLLPLSEEGSFIDNAIGDGAVRTIGVGANLDESIGDDNNYSTGAGDVDVYTFVPTSSGDFEFKTLTNNTFSADTLVRLFDSAGREIAYNDNADATTTASTLRQTLTAGQTYYLVVSGASPTARNYDPLRGTGASAGSSGAYTLVVGVATGIDASRYRSASSAVETTAASSAGQTIVATNSATGRPLAFQQNTTTGAWSVQDLTAKTGGPPISGELQTWVDPKDGLTYTLARGSAGMLLYTNRNNTWTLRNLTTELAGKGAITGSGFTQFTTTDGKIAFGAIADNGQVVLYIQTGAGSAGNWAWDFTNLSVTHLQAQGLATPVFTGKLVSYVTSWDGLNLAGLDAQGLVQSIWWAPGLSLWTTSNLSQITNAPRLTGGLTAYVTSWDAINLVGADVQGKVSTTWWVPSFGGNWVTSNLTDAFGGPKLIPASMTSYVTPWGGTNIAGIEADGTVTIYWWSPGLDNWSVTRISDFIAGATKITGSLTGYTSPTGEINLAGASSPGDVLRYHWKPGTDWTQDNLTQIAVPG